MSPISKLGSLTVIRCGDATVRDALAAVRIAGSLGLPIRQRLPRAMTGFAYLWYLPKARRSGKPYLYLGGTCKTPADEYYGSSTTAGAKAATRESGVRLIIGATCGDAEAVCAIEREHTERLDVATDPRFINKSNAAGAGYGKLVAVAFHNSPKHAAVRARWLAGRAAAARKAAATRRKRKLKAST